MKTIFTFTLLLAAALFAPSARPAVTENVVNLIARLDPLTAVAIWSDPMEEKLLISER